ncbi:MAG: hypothetical protein L0Y75_08760 [Acidobacteria bacterium]|nr:hypothetical protein [Acidobacteriota bacterium]
MAKSTKTVPQAYPRINDDSRKDYGCLDEMAEIYKRQGKELFSYFKKYSDDPASTADKLFGKHYREVGIEQFRNRTLQKERMNSGWRYQYLAHDCATHSGRFSGVSDLGAAEADFNATIKFRDRSKGLLSLYVSVKNRSNTMGGQDWPKAIQALDNVAKNDRNRTGPYCCIFGIAIDRGSRYIKREKKTGRAYSENTEVWMSDFFWPFFSNHSYEEIMTLVWEVLQDLKRSSSIQGQISVPDGLLESFGECCRLAGLVDEQGVFNDPRRLIQFFCR